MTSIQVKHLTKVYQVHHKEPGIKGTLKGLVKRHYTPITAVKDISFSLEQGEVVGFIGPNGAGKTTTLKMLAGLLYPTSGQVSVLGFDPWQRSYDFLRQISLVMGQKNQLWWNLPAIETFRLFKDIYALDEKIYRQSLDFLVETLNFNHLLHTQVRKLSLGERMKAELIAALLHQPKVLFLDEPTIGLDVMAQKHIRQFLADYNRQFKATILLTSHYMDDVRFLAKRIILINQGKIVYDGQLQTIISRYATYKEVEIVFAQPVDHFDFTQLGELKRRLPTKVILKVKRDQLASAISLILKQFSVIDINIRELSLEEIISLIFTSSV